MGSNSYMESGIEFKAPWSKSLRVASTVVCSVLLMATAVAVAVWWQTRQPLLMALMFLPLVLVVIGLFCMVRGYVLAADEIVVKRLGWANRLPIQDLLTVNGDNEAMSHSLRLFANGGVLSFSGYFWNRKLGRYRAFATDPSRAVILRYPKRKIVITPDDPQRFIVRLRTQLKNR
jgi:hypothetical protein